MARPLAAHALLSLAGASPEAAAAGQRSSKAPLAAAAPTAVRLQCISARAAVAPQQHRGQRRSQRRLVCQQHAAAIRAAPPAALEMVASSEAVPSSKQSMRALSQRQRLRDVFQCQHEAALAACSLLLLLLWLVLARDANQPPGRSHGSPCVPSVHAATCCGSCWHALTNGSLRLRDSPTDGKRCKPAPGTVAWRLV